MRRLTLSVIAFLASAGATSAAATCQDYVKLKDLPNGFKVVSKSALGPAELRIASDGICTCNDLPAVQRSLGQGDPSEINWACDAADPSDTKSK